VDFIYQSTKSIAQELLGKKLAFNNEGKWVSGYIVETEAYLGVVDQACHGYQGKRTPRVESLYLEGGAVYVYQMHRQHLLNIVTREAGVPEAVLIRAIQPVDHLELMVSNRNKEGLDVSNGPGKLTQAMGITKALDGTLVGVGTLKITEGLQPRHISASPRIGIPNKGEWTEAPLRFYVTGNPYVSQMPKKSMVAAAESWENKKN